MPTWEQEPEQQWGGQCGWILLSKGKRQASTLCGSMGQNEKLEEKPKHSKVHVKASEGNELPMAGSMQVTIVERRDSSSEKFKTSAQHTLSGQ